MIRRISRFGVKRSILRFGICRNWAVVVVASNAGEDGGCKHYTQCQQCVGFVLSFVLTRSRQYELHNL
ncbi:unnamed protein product [Gongylonema pulchrum]|uniref:Secreted protein n=1 Tax=Gongylonema pulchrum TaxID=637853 RepID=A0A183EBA4_9BILA|nr:unnamed protein product [Gongylonema pulchrum]